MLAEQAGRKTTRQLELLGGLQPADLFENVGNISWRQFGENCKTLWRESSVGYPESTLIYYLVLNQKEFLNWPTAAPVDMYAATGKVLRCVGNGWHCVDGAFCHIKLQLKLWAQTGRWSWLKLQPGLNDLKATWAGENQTVSIL